ncbi:phosphotransferase family protein [Herbidospora mongoliensis]|uniref:phosphotransferase family protein n=1 Tax=Herbidospora mongoliensis TaxID=688067 RepID=UPI000A0392B6|nr:phosphotransferase [Herbidospora mongoliensis]
MPLLDDPLLDDLIRHVGDGPVTVLKNTKVLVVRVGNVVVKAHPPETDEADLRARLAVPLPDDLMLSALSLDRIGDRLVSVWPAGRPLTPDDLDEAPWERAGELLAELHRQPVPDGVPMQAGPSRVTNAVGRLMPGDIPVLAYPALDLTQRRRLLTHGDFHLGQLVKYGGRWVLIDPDDLGWGDPVWDLARPAAWFASGILDPGSWDQLTRSYLRAGGTAVSGDDMWRELDGPARALTVQLAAVAVANAREDGVPLDDAAAALMSSCERILAVPPLS